MSIGASTIAGATPVNERVGTVSTPASGIQPQLVLKGSVLHAVYFAGDPTHGDIFYTRSTDFGKTFFPAIRVNSQEGSAIGIGSIRGAQIAVGKDACVHVAWNGSDTAEPRGPINPEAGKPSSPMLWQGYRFLEQEDI